MNAYISHRAKSRYPKAVNSMLGENGARNFFSQIQELWIKPEIARRQKAGNLGRNFVISRCLIKLPAEKPPIIEFNDEIGWVARVKKAPGTSFEMGQKVYLHEVQKIENVSRPEVDGQPVAFVYVFFVGKDSWRIIFDFTPNVSNKLAPDKEGKPWPLGKEIADSLQALIVDMTVHAQDKIRAQLQKIGLWAAPSLLPYPISKIAKQLEEGKTIQAIETLLAYCTPEYIEELSTKWWTVAQFRERKKLIQQAIEAHKERKYELSIHAMLPQIEGIITDWVYTQLPEKEVPFRPESKTKKFRDLVLKRATTYSYERIVESTINFILGGPVLKTFKRWVAQINTAFPNRHAVEHGKYDQALFTEENSLKLFLLVDTLYFIVSSQQK